MTSDRPYRRAMSQTHALEQIHDGTASQFDPDIVTAFLDLASEGTLTSE
jgi:HD-GYP domain-containing protein (c-di-GMP phosphodiesterase class II)